jgi:RNA polymerase sigma-70 factor (ECF subfamily)
LSVVSCQLQRTTLSRGFPQAISNLSVLPKKFLNNAVPVAVFMIEGKRLAAGEAVLSEAATVARRPDEMIEELVRQHSRLVYRIAYAALRAHHDAEDAAQETFLRVLRYSGKLATVDDHKAWLARIAWRVAVERGQRRGRKREIPLNDPEKPTQEVPSSDTPADESMHGAQFGALLERLIEALPEKLRQPLILSAVEEMSAREVAAALGINEAAVRSRVFRARQILKEKLAGRMKRKP